MHDVIWDDIKIFESVNHSFNGFLQNYISLHNECFPKIKTKLNSQKHFCPWITEAGSQRGLTTAINFAFSKDTGEGPVMRSKSDNME